MIQQSGLEQLLGEHPFFDDMPAAAREVLAGCAVNQRAEAGAYIFREGGPADNFYLIRSGAVAIELHVPGREPMVLQTLRDGDVLGYSWLVPPYRWAFDARAVQLTRLVSLDARCLRGKCDADPALGYELLKRFIPVSAERLAAARLQLIDMYGRPDTADRTGP